MTKDEYWQAHVKRNPRFEDEEAKIQMSVGMLRKLMEEAFDKGWEHHRKTSDMMKEIFGGIDLNQYRKWGGRMTTGEKEAIE
jgi:hypothetical protein